MFERPRLALAASLLLITLASCSPSRPADSPPVSDRWYVLENGRLIEVAASALPTSADQALVPWTTAERIAGFARLGGAVYAAVNGYGVARIASGPGQAGGFGYFYDRSLFRGRTLQTLLSGPQGLLCHVYRNSLLSEPAYGEGPEPPNLVRMRPGAEGHEADFIVPPFQASGPGWQVVSVVQPGESRLWLEWKRAAGEAVEFAYTTFDPQTGQEEAASRDEFRRAGAGVSLYGFAPRPGRAVDLLIDALASSADEEDYIHVTVGGGAAPVHYVRVPAAGGGSTREAWVFAEEGRALALAPDGTLLAATDGSPQVSSFALPRLPAGCVYSAVSAAGSTVIAAWEQADFYRVGRAGLLLTTAAF